MAVEAPLEELRHREHVGTQIERDKNPAEDQQNQARQPFKGADGKTGGCAGTRETDEVLGRDVGNEKRRADGEPADIAARQEVVLRGALLAGEVEADPKHEREVDANDDEVDGGERSVGHGHSRSEEHQCLL